MSQSTGSAKPCACRKITGCQAQAAGRLFLWFPVPHTLAKGIAYLKQEKLEYQLMQERSGLNVICQSGQAKDIACGIAQLLAPMEISETRVLFNRGKAQPQLHDFSDITSLQRFLKLSESDWLVNMLAEERFVNHFQPIVSIQDTTQIYGYESLIRGVDEQGNLVMPESILTAATEAGLLAQLDRIARLRAIAQASQHQLMGRLFINFTPTALYDPVSCLRSTVEAIDAAGISHDQVVFEVVESDNPQDVGHLKTVLKFYREAGFLVALDDLGAGYSSLNLLHQLRPDFIKLDMEMIRDVHCDLYKASITEKLLEIAQKLNIQTVAEGIECVEELAWLRDRGATLAQGYLIARPKAELVTTTPTFALNPPIINLTDPTKAQPGVHHQSESERIIAAVNQRIQESLELDEILQTTADEVRQLFNADRVVIYQFEDDWSGRVAVESLAAGCTSILDFHARDTCFQSTHATYYQEGNSRAIADMEVAELSPCYVELLRSLQIRASLIVPILHQDNLWGLLIAHQCYEARQWQQSEINLFNQLAGQAAIAIHQSELYQQLRQANQELQRLATSDGLTQVANRRCFDETLASEWQSAAQEQTPLSLILCDIDCFKRYNDTHGHLAGDDVLKTVAQTIEQTVKGPANLVARYGGEEFAVILPNLDAAGAIAIADQIQSNINALKISHPNSPVSPFVTLSLGVATVTPQPHSAPAGLIADADQGLYQAKAKGRSCTVLHNSETFITADTP
ncbi:MAG: EAL domain-containing protein [Cyanobacteria bacterium P01_D01_bin.115]